MRFILVLAVALLSVISVSATHLRSGYIHITQTEGLKCTIFVQVYTNTVSTSVLFGGDQDYLDFGDGSKSFLIPQQPNIYLPEFEPHVASAFYVVEHEYRRYGKFTVSYREPNRNEGILNIANSVNTHFYIESTFTLEPGKHYRSPELLARPMIFSSVDDVLTASMAASDVNDYTLYYTEATPKSDRNVVVEGYIRPKNYTLNSRNGVITWDGTLVDSKHIGEVVVTVVIEQWSDGKLVGSMSVDCQIIRDDHERNGSITDNQELNDNNRIFVPQNGSHSLKVFAYHENDETVTFEPYSELVEVENAFSFEAYDSIYEGQKIKVGLLALTNTPATTRTNPYAILVRTKFARSAMDFYLRDINYTYYTTDVELPEEPFVPVANEELIESIVVAPNPTADKLTFVGGAGEVSSFELINVSGQMQIIPVKRGENSVNIAGIPSGFYIARIRNTWGQIQWQGKIVKR